MSLDQDLVAGLRRRVRGEVKQNEPLAGFTTFRVGGPADLLVEAEDVDDLVAVAEVLGGRLPVAVVGRGSNLLVSDEGFRGVAIRLGKAFRAHDRTDRGLRLGGSVYLPAAAKLTARLGLTGFEFAAEIPATFGGAVRMNAGAHGRSMADVLLWAESVDLTTGQRQHLSVHDLAYGYRSSTMRGTQVVVAGEIELAPDDPAMVASRIRDHLAWRREHQPPGRSAGSVFKNPDGDSAGRLIEAAGLKGHRIGGAEVSVVHANFIVADRDATASDVWRLIGSVRDVVRERFGVDLEPEVRFLGAFPQVESQVEGGLEG